MMRWNNLLFVRFVIALALIGVGYCAVTRSFAAALSQSDPLSALAVSSSDARVMARAAQVMMERNPTKNDRLRAKELSVNALTRDGTTVPAITTLGFLAGLDGNDKLGADWFAYSERLSRRDFLTQLYFIETSVSDGAVDKALHHYDTALRASEDNAPSILFPILRGAIADQSVRRELAKTLAARPLWSERFVADLVGNGPNFVAAAQLIAEARGHGAVIPRASEEVLMTNLVGHGQIPVAWRFYLSTHPRAARLLIRNGSFGAGRAENTPFDWQVMTGDGVSVSLGAGENDQTLDYRVSPTIGAPLVRQMILLAAGRYRLVSVVTAASQRSGSGPYWEFKCFDGRAIGALEIGGPIVEPRGFSLEVVVPSNCEAQVLTLIARASDDVQGATGQVGSVSISGIR